MYHNSSNDKVVYYYGTNGKLSHTADFSANTHTKYIYDLAGRIVEQKVYSGTDLSGINLLSSVKYKYAENTGETESITYSTAVGSQDYICAYGNIAVGTNPDAVYGVSYNGNDHIEYNYDGLGRLTERKLSVPDKSHTYTYKVGGHGANSTTTLVESETSSGITFGYTYDQNGNITEVKENGVTVKSYAYGNDEWKDLLTSFNGQTITYDEIGNPLNYRGKNMSWQRGRMLVGITDESNIIVYAYDIDGNRISKIVNGVTTDYIVIDGTLIGEITGENKLAFLYDESGTKYGFVYNGAMYFYNFNLQDDVVGIYDSTGAELVTYTYDEWGKVLSVTGTLADTIGQINPIRYRGYYYDAETGFYYVSSRYYVPEIGRFINADGYVSTGQDINGFNMFAYCGNNPVNRMDPTGTFWKEIGTFFAKTWNNVKKWAKNTFGEEHTVSNTVSKKIIPEPSPIVITSGSTTTTMMYENNNSNSIVGYTDSSKNGRTIASTMGVRINKSKIAADFCIGLENIGVSVSYAGENSTKALGLRLNMNELKFGLEYSSTIQWDTDITNTTFTNVSISAVGVVMAYALATGYYAPAIQK